MHGNRNAVQDCSFTKLHILHFTFVLALAYPVFFSVSPLCNVWEGVYFFSTIHVPMLSIDTQCVLAPSIRPDTTNSVKKLFAHSSLRKFFNAQLSCIKCSGEEKIIFGRTIIKHIKQTQRSGFAISSQLEVGDSQGSPVP